MVVVSALYDLFEPQDGVQPFLKSELLRTDAARSPSEPQVHLVDSIRLSINESHSFPSPLSLNRLIESLFDFSQVSASFSLFLLESHDLPQRLKSLNLRKPLDFEVLVLQKLRKYLVRISGNLAFQTTPDVLDVSDPDIPELISNKKHMHPQTKHLFGNPQKPSNLVSCVLHVRCRLRKHELFLFFLAKLAELTRFQVRVEKVFCG